jgi:hypothetical protein
MTYKVGKIYNVCIFEPSEAKTYLKGYYAHSAEEALEQARAYAVRFGHTVRQIVPGQPYQRIDGPRVQQTSRWYHG